MSACRLANTLSNETTASYTLHCINDHHYTWRGAAGRLTKSTWTHLHINQTLQHPADLCQRKPVGWNIDFWTFDLKIILDRVKNNWTMHFKDNTLKYFILSQLNVQRQQPVYINKPLQKTIEKLCKSCIIIFIIKYNNKMYNYKKLFLLFCNVKKSQKSWSILLVQHFSQNIV